MSMSYSEFMSLPVPYKKWILEKIEKEYRESSNSQGVVPNNPASKEAAMKFGKSFGNFG